VDPRCPEDYGWPADLPADTPRAALGDRVRAGDIEGLRRALKNALGADEAVIKDPTGSRVMVSQAIVDHMLERPKSRWDGREAFFPLIPELIEDPFEIWVSFAVNEVSGRIALRRRYVKMIAEGKKRTLGMWAEVMENQWVAHDFYRGGVTGANNMRKGRLLWARQ